MSFSFGGSKKNTTASQQSKTDPWDPTVSSLKQLISDMNSNKQWGPTSEQSSAFDSLIAKAKADPSPYYTQIDQLAKDMFGHQSRAGTVEDAYRTLQTNINDIAAGKNLDPNTNPYIAQMMKQVGDDIENRTKQTFAGAGRHITGNAAGFQAMGRGISAGQTPILAQFFNDEQNRMMDANKTLFGAGRDTATTAQGLDESALSTRAGGIDAGKAALTARDYGDNTVLNLEQQKKDMGQDDMSKYASLLLSIAGMGGQQQGSGQSNTKGSSWGTSFGMSDLGKLISGLGSLSDERAKEDIEEVGMTNDGQKIYRYRLKGDPRYHVGLLAQEVERRHPEAVAESGGLKRVNYKLATDDAVGG